MFFNGVFGKCQLIQLSDEKIAICSQWGKGNIKRFLSKAKKLGYKIAKTT